MEEKLASLGTTTHKNNYKNDSIIILIVTLTIVLMSFLIALKIQNKKLKLFILSIKFVEKL